MIIDKREHPYMSTETYTQCCLVYASGKIDVAWIPSKFAVRGKKLTINEESCIVKYKYNTRSAEDLLAFERDYINQRSASDI